MEQSDLVVVGGGLVGLATALTLLKQFPKKKVVVLEKEADVALHQSGRNSGVLHAGVYYKPGSAKAKNCREGKALLEAYCTQHEIAFRCCGKVIVACDESELPGLQRIYERGVENGAECELIDAARLRELEPAVRGVRAIHVKDTGVVDFKGVAAQLRREIEQNGGAVRCGAKVAKIQVRGDRAVISTSGGEIECRFFVNCAGLYSDRILEMSGEKAPAKIIPFRGEYYMVRPESAQLCRTLIYPVPNPLFPFLGVHFTRGVHDDVECGPNAVFAFAREGYRFSKVNVAELAGSLSYSGLWSMAKKHWRYALDETATSLSKTRFLTKLQRLVPSITSADLLPGPAGVRAQAVLPDGSPVDDFFIHETGVALHVLNAPSPAATSCLSIGKSLAERVKARAIF